MTRRDIRALARDLDRLERHLHAATRPRAKGVDDRRVGPFGAMLLATIADHQPVPIQSLAQLLARDKAQMTRAIQMLEERGLIERSRSPEDGRVWLVRLTTPGEHLHADFQGLFADVVTELTADLSDTDLERFSNILARLVAPES